MGIGDWGLGPIPNPQSPIPNPQSPFNYYYYYLSYILFKNLNNFLIVINVKYLIKMGNHCTCLNDPRNEGEEFKIGQGNYSFKKAVFH